MNELSVSMSAAGGPVPSVVLPDPPPEVTARGLNFYYGEHHALKNMEPDAGHQRVTAYRAVRCGKSTLLRGFNRMYEFIPGQRATGQVMLDSGQHPRSQARPQSAAGARRHGVPEADAVPDDDL